MYQVDSSATTYLLQSYHIIVFVAFSKLLNRKYGTIIVAELFPNVSGELCNYLNLCVLNQICKCVKKSLNLYSDLQLY